MFAFFYIHAIVSLLWRLNKNLLENITQILNRHLESSSWETIEGTL